MGALLRGACWLLGWRRHHGGDVTFLLAMVFLGEGLKQGREVVHWVAETVLVLELVGVQGMEQGGRRLLYLFRDTALEVVIVRRESFYQWRGLLHLHREFGLVLGHVVVCVGLKEGRG